MHSWVNNVMNKYGKVALIGAGPGDLDLLTLKGKEYLRKADCIVYDRLCNKKMLELANSDCEMIFVGKANHHHTMKQDDINELLFEKAKEYDFVVRLKGGDPYVFGRGGEEALYLKEREISVEIVPGVSSSIAALADAGIPITHRGLAKGFQVITAHSRKDEPTNIDFTQLLDEDVTLVFLMGLAHVGEIARGLINAGRSADTKAAVVSNGTTNHQRKVVGTISNIEDLVNEAGLESPSIIVVGKVVGLASELDFFEKRPFFGKRFFLPKIQSFNYKLETGITEILYNELEERLEKDGAKVTTVVTGKIKPVECDLGFIKLAALGDYIVFTSGNGVRSFFWNLFERYGKDIRAIADFRFAVVGEKTAAILREFGIVADLIPEKQIGAELAELLKKNVNAGTNLYWLCGKVQSPEFEKTLGDAYSLNKIVCYENVGSELTISDELRDEIRKCDGAIFTSGSNAKAVKGIALPDKVYSIGPSCTKVLNDYGINQVSEAEVSSYEGIIKSLLSEV